ncbi:molybdopterin-dependent oxidoreductase [Photobacterium sp. 1_MG-2023]|uniref:molybdopterin-dependent oxidoreductase n=1 Tax=Photobacterium sp. 1_MG-2023 TaxID=3062646 RepID=UPI0026E2A1AB|nr:molybdopterin-dependent oxidoreductase [Photobacterium sp. 1_MG-2023]MDO6708666.1 molybdopterin-dependent oxidoreductase [Photobacterium sp. 1_MG-2023]
MTVELKRGYCTLCRSRCGTIHHVRNDHLVKVAHDPSHPTGGAMCMKGRSAPELVDHPDRIRYPMKRTQPKTAKEPGWVRISWEEALNTIALKLNQIKQENGAEAVAFGVTTPSGTPISDSIDWIERFIRRFGSPNISYGTEVCNWHKDYAHALTFGCGMPTADYRHADLIMLWGHNPTNTWLSQANAIAEGRKRGAKLLVIDPRKTPLAASADVWLQVLPGTDAAVAMGLIRLLIQNSAYDLAFTQCWTNATFLVRSDNGQLLRANECEALPGAPTGAYVGWNQQTHSPEVCQTQQEIKPAEAGDLALDGSYLVRLADGHLIECEPVFSRLKQACSAYTPAQVEKISGVKAHDLLQAAQLLATNQRIAYHAWTGIAQQKNATQAERAIAILYALTGSFDQAGGNRQYRQPPICRMDGQAFLSEAQKKKALGYAERPLGPAAQGWVNARDLYHAMIEAQPYAIRAFFGFGSNSLLSQADVSLGVAALQQLEFHVHCDLFETPTAQFADILLPINTPWEREGLRVGFEINADAVSHIQLREQMVSSRNESKSDADIVFALACKMGMADEFFQGDLEAGWNAMLAPLGISVADLRRNPGGISYPLTQRTEQYRQTFQGKIRGFNTPSQRVELYSETLLNAGYSPVPEMQHNAFSAAFPLRLTSVKSGYFCHSQHRSLASLRKRSPLPMAMISDHLAQQKGIVDGDWIMISTSEGQAHFCVSIDPDLDSTVVVAEFGWWQACPDIGREAFPFQGDNHSNFNQLISARHADPVSGSVPMRDFACQVSLSPRQDVNRRSWHGKIAFQVRRKRRIAQGVVALELEAETPRLLPDFLPGQHITLSLVQNEDQQTPLTRSYSLTGACQISERRTYQIAVRLQTSVNGVGQMSDYIHHQLEEGQRIDVSAPAGKFVLPRESVLPVVLFAGGIGITPFLSFLESIDDASAMPEIWLHYANRNSATHAFAARLKTLSGRLPNLHIVNYYNEPLASDTQGRDFDTTDFVSGHVVTDDLIRRRARFYLCGPEAMMQSITQQLIARDVPAFDIFSEVFRSPVVPSPPANQQFRVTFSKSAQREHIWTSDSGTLLEFAENQQIKMNSGCRVGQCESCAVRIVSGEVMHLHGQEPEDPQTCFTCQAIPVSDLELDV